MDSCVTLLIEKAFDFVLCEIGRDLNREGHDESRIIGFFSSRCDGFENRSGRVLANQLAATAAMLLGPSGEQQFYVVIELGHRADRAA